MKNYVFECRVCHNKDKADNSYERISDSCYLMSADRHLFDESTHCPVDGEKDAEFEFIGTSRGINPLPEAL